jgi:hypothetical protein
MSLSHVKRVQFNTTTVTTDTASALRQLEKRAATMKDVRLSITGPKQSQMTWDGARKNPGPTGLPPEWSALPTGREVYLGIEILDDTLSPESRTERALATLWALAIPLGFTPFARYPLPGPHMSVFHFMGTWAIVMDHMLGAGRGEAAWPGFCAAAQADADAWEESKQTERYVQAHLHRLGFNCGAIDGIVANNTLASMKALGVAGRPLMDVATELGTRGTPARRPSKQKVLGSIDLGDVDFSIASYGQIHTMRTPKGAQISVGGPGRIVVDVQEP